MPLAENREEIHILPASYGIEESLHLEGTKILMKAGRKMPEVKKILVERKMDARMVQNCGMEANAGGVEAWDSGEGRGGRGWVDPGMGNPFPTLRRPGAARAWRSGRPWKLPV